MNAIKKYQYIPVFTPRFRLSDATLVGFEVRIKRAQRVLSANEVLKLIQSGNDNDFLDVINSHWSQWCKKAETSLYLSWEVCSKTCPGDLQLFLEQLSLALPSQQLEIVLNAHDLTANEAIRKAQELYEDLPENYIRRGLFHCRPIDFDVHRLLPVIDVFKLNKGVISEMKDDLLIASKGRYFIERISSENIDIVVDDLYSKSDVTSSILMGIHYGQGYFLSRNQTPQKPARTLNKSPGKDFYERRMDWFMDPILA